VHKFQTGHSYEASLSLCILNASAYNYNQNNTTKSIQLAHYGAKFAASNTSFNKLPSVSEAHSKSVSNIDVLNSATYQVCHTSTYMRTYYLHIILSTL